ncbi:MtN3-like protein, partial [Phytophthora palmivora]
MLYGYLTDNLFPLAATQAFSQLAAIIYSAIYFKWSSKLKRKELAKLYTRALALHCVVTLYFALGVMGVTGQSKAEVGTWFGYVGVIINVWMYASPLGTLKQVMKTKNSASIPINLSVMILISTLLWLGTGILENDLFIAGINSVGALLSFVQIVVYFHYKPDRHQEPLTTVKNDMSVVIVSPKDHSTSSTPSFVDASSYKPIGIWVDILNVATAVAQVILSLSLTPDLYSVHRRKSTGEMVALPLVAMAVNNHAWMLYGYLADNMFPIFATQAFSQTAALTYNAIFFRWTVPEKRKDLYKLYSRAFAVHCAFSIYTILGVAGVTNQTKGQVGDYVGYAAIVINIWMYASPLGTLKH